MELTHASFFSGVGGLDLGLERAGWRTVSFSEIDPYASAVLAERWPGVPNLGDIVLLQGSLLRRDRADDQRGRSDQRVPAATVWSGGFPCQDLSVAGKRAGMGTHGDRADTRSGLAYAFLDLVERHRPPALVLENVPGLLSSNAGRDFGALLGRLAELGYWWAYRILDAQYFGVPQRRRRVFILALHAGAGFGADSAAAVLSVGSRCDGHSAAGDAAGAGAAEGAENRIAPAVRAGGHGDPGIGRDNDEDRLIFNATAKFGEFVEDDTAGNLSARDYKSSNHLIGAPPDPGGVRAPDGLAGRLDDSAEVAATLNSGGNDGGFRTEPGAHLMLGSVQCLDNSDGQGTGGGAQAGALAAPEQAEAGAAASLAEGPVIHAATVAERHVLVNGKGSNKYELLPLGLDSHRYRCCGNGVVSNVAEWIGVRLAETLA